MEYNNKAFLLFLFFGFSYLPFSLGQKPFIIAHMTNTRGTVRWALDNGASGVEMDLNFDRCGNPTEFKHGGACDCSCRCAANGKDCSVSSVCHQLWVETGSHCGASTNAGTMFDYLGSDGIKEKLSVIYIDSKLDNKLIEYYKAGENVVNLMNEKIFDRGYNGQVIINGLKFKYLEYLRGALNAAKNSTYADKYFYTFDGEERDYEKVWNGLLQLGTPNIFYSTGISACILNRYYDSIKGSLVKESYAGIGIWTVDTKFLMKKYLEMGATAIITNKPAVGMKAIDPAKKLQQGEQALFPKITILEPNLSWEWDCECNYHLGESILGGGGCSIMLPPPSGKACKCTYVGAWTCKGENIGCTDSNSEKCKNPDISKSTCDFGGGDCSGYQC